MATKIKLRVPKDIELELDGGQDASGNDITVTKPFRFSKDFLRRHVLNDKRWVQDNDWLYAGMEIRGEFEDVKEDEIVELTSDQYKKLKESVEKPTGGWNLVPQVMFQIKTYLDAILEPVKPEDLVKKKPADEMAAPAEEPQLPAAAAS
jgi:hypothetical protein